MLERTLAGHFPGLGWSAFRLHLRFFPDRIHREIIGRAWALLGTSQAFRKRLADLEGKRIALKITDTGNCWAFQVRWGELWPLTERAGWDVRIQGPLQDFLLLALGQEDADTLFFNRRMVLEGETATGVFLKNFLEGLDLDWEAHHREMTACLPAFLRQQGRDALHRLRPEERLLAWANRALLGEGPEGAWEEPTPMGREEESD